MYQPGKDEPFAGWQTCVAAGLRTSSSRVTRAAARESRDSDDSATARTSIIMTSCNFCLLLDAVRQRFRSAVPTIRAAQTTRYAVLGDVAPLTMTKTAFLRRRQKCS